MNTNWQSPLLCSIDAEFTGFDISTDELIELGLVFFRLTPNGLVIEKEWANVFRPTKNVKTRILGLTGIADTELKTAQPVRYYLKELKELLQDATFVGHNLIVDLKFVEALGIRPSQKTIDTLELVQFILPTFHSYNLENLAHEFGINESDHHRALTDARITANLLYKLLAIYQGYSELLKTKVSELVQGYLLEDVLSWPILADISKQSPVFESNSDSQLESISFQIAHDKSPSLLVGSNTNRFLRLWHDKQLQYIPNPKTTFHKDELNRIIDLAPQSYPEILTLLKLLVWSNINWQTETTEDLNTSFSGQSASALVSQTAPDWPNSLSPILGLKIQTALSALQDHQFTNRTWIFENFDRLEDSLTKRGEISLSWQSLVRIIKNSANLDNASCERLIAEVDLFFGLLGIQLKKYTWLGNEVLITDLEPIHLQLLHSSAQNLSHSLENIINVTGEDRLLSATHLLSDFFCVNEHNAHWIAISDIRYRLIKRPISPDAGILHATFKQQSIGLLSNTYSPATHLILERLQLMDCKTSARKGPDLSVKLQVLNTTKQDILRICQDTPAVLVFPNTQEAVDFYEVYGLELRKSSAVYMHRYSGGLSKIFRNYRLKNNSILLVTANQLAESQVKISPKTLVYLDKPQQNPPLPAYERAVAHRHNLNLETMQTITQARIHTRAWQNIVKTQIENLVILNNSNSTEFLKTQIASLIQEELLLIHMSV